jgi:beta-phosphoglucomutase-like phosphatase (HAD superfamily)
MLPKAILFDLDDTIISFDSHTESAWIKTCKNICRRSILFSYNELLKSINDYKKTALPDNSKIIPRENKLNSLTSL